MPDDLTGPLTAALEEIRERHRAASENATDTDLIASQLDVPVLLAALEAVLALAASAKVTTSRPPADCTGECWLTDCNCSGVRRPLAWDLNPAKVREAITRALTGEEAGDGRFGVGDLITYRPVHEGVPPHRAHVERVEDWGLIVLDEQPGMPLTHLVTWDRVIGKADG